MANGAFKFKDNSGNVVSFISGSGSDIMISGGTLDLSGMSGLTLGNLTMSGTTQNAVSTSHAASYLLTSSFNSYSGTTNTVIGTLQTSTGSLNTFSSSTNNRLSSIETSTSSLNTFTSSATSRLSSIEGVSGSYATTGSNQFKNDQVITGSLTVTGFIDAQELRTTYISSSILYRSGSTKFGDELTDTHAFTGSVLISGSLSVPGQNIITRSGGGEVNELTFFNGTNTVGGTSALSYNFPQLVVGVSSAGNNSDYNLLIHRHGNIGNPGSGTATPALYVTDFAGDGPASYSNLPLVEISYPRISSTDTNAANASLLRLALDDMVAMQVSAKGRTFIGQSSQSDNGQLLQVNGTSRFDGNSTFTSDVTVSGKMGIGGAPESGYVLTLKGNGVDSPLLLLQGLANPTAKLGDTTTGTSDVGNLWLYNDGTLRIRLDSDTAGTSYINANKFVVGATTSNNALFRVRYDSTDAVYFSKIQAVFGPSDYLDSDACDVFGGGTSETQFTNGNSSRPAMLSLGGSLNTAEALGVINFFRSSNSDNYRSRVQLWAGVQSTGTANQHGGYLEIRTANDGVAAPAALAQFEARGSFLLYRRNDNMTFADSVGALYVRQNGNHGATEEEFRIVGRNIGFFSHTGTRHAGINSSGILGIGYAGAPAATSKLFISRSDQYGLHFDAATGYGRIQTTDDNLYLKVGSNDMISINSSSITLSSTVTAANVATPNFTILETGVSKTVTGYGYDATQPMAMVITQTAQTTMGLMRASEDTTGATLRGMKARGNASTIASPLNGDDIFSVEGWAWHGSGPNYPKLGGGMKFVKDDNWGTANTRAPMRTEFYNANSTTTTQTTMVLYPSGLLTLPASSTTSKFNLTSGGISKQHLVNSKTAAASGTALKLFYVGFNHAVRLYLFIQQDSSNIATAVADFTTAYGSSSGGITYSSRLGNISSISASYNNGGSPAYTIDVTVNYSGAAPTIYATIEGISNDSMYLV